MKIKKVVAQILNGLRIALSSIALFQFALGGPVANAQDRPNETATPIKHVIVIIGENRSFDHVFATYVPRPGQRVHNLLSEGIIQLDANKNAIPGPRFDKAHQLSASDLGSQDTFLLNPPKQEFPSNQLPAPEAGGPSGANGYFSPSSSKYTTIACGTITVNGVTKTNYLTPQACAVVTENGLPNAADANGLTYYQSLASGGTNQYSYTPDLRIVNFDNLPAGPFQLTNGTKSATPGYSLTYTDYGASPVHRFYQMWQQLNCSLEHASWENPSGCDGKLFSWVEATVGAGTNGLSQSLYAQGYYGSTFSEFFTYPAPYSATNPPTAAEWTANEYALYDSVPTTTGEGSTALGFYNVQQGDVPYFKSLADNYAMSDNFHQSVNGGTGANHIMLGHGDAIWFSDGAGNALAPPQNVQVDPGTANAGVVNEVENPNPAPNTNNWYTQDGYGGGSFGAASYGGGSYTNCADTTQPGVAPIVNYLQALPHPIAPNCEAGHYYLLNN